MEARAKKRQYLDRMHSHITTKCQCCGRSARRAPTQLVSMIRICADCEQAGSHHGADMGMYVLDRNNIPIPCFNTLAWGAWFQRAKRHVADEWVDGYRISTVFLGLDHNHARFFGGDQDPILFETIVFSPDWREDSSGELYMNRYHTWAEAKADNERMVSIIRLQVEHAAKVTRDMLARVQGASE